MSVLARTHISVQERKGGSESIVEISADLTQFCLRKSSSGSYLPAAVNSRDVLITPDTYLFAKRNEEENQVYSTLQTKPSSLSESQVRDHI
jgi:hypothetical protein